MAGKNTISRRIDAGGSSADGAEVFGTVDDTAPPAIKSIPEPTDVTATGFLSRSAITPTAYLSIEWVRPEGAFPEGYIVQVSEDSSFPTASTVGVRTHTESATVDGLKTNKLYYIRVAALYRAIQSGWSDTASETTPVDTTPPNPVTS